MPAYDYRCPSCSAVFEIVRPIDERGEVACPQCGSAARQVFRPVGVVFKGSGFHNTDYRPRPSEDVAPSSEPCCGSDDGDSCGSCQASPAAPDD